ncbi:cytoplasmic protein [Panaeolus papilionaceus]|nr:cytoplasmic protein [Panaeolus papilionaceus]
MWEPLPLIVYGYAIHPLIPSRRETRISSRNRLSTVTEASTDDHSVLRDVVSLEVGDEVYAFEKYTPSPREPVEGIWYRGYVVCTTRRPPVTWALSDPSSSTSLSKPSLKVEETQQVFIGIFPASHIFVRDELADAEGRLSEIARSLNGGSVSSIHGPYGGRNSPADIPAHWGKDKSTVGMDTVKEEDEDLDIASIRRTFKLGPPPDQASSSRAALSVRTMSVRSSSPTDSRLVKPMPPRPSLVAGDNTASGSQQPIIDEIASALREWHTLMFQYLARRDYKLFAVVKEHIEALHLGRRQLLANTLSADETVNMRRECVSRLVNGNLVQGLDVIVRHPTWGGLVTVDVEGDIDPRSWVSAVRMYTMQVSLAYRSINYTDSKPYNLMSSMDYVASAPLPTPAHSAFPDFHPHHPHSKTRSRSTACLVDESSKQAPIKFYHVFFDLRAFVASPCAPGETAELFFSLYQKQGMQFFTEEFCAVLNHNGVLARDPSSRIRTLFVDLATSDIQEPIYLVCKIVRTGSLKLGNSLSSGVPDGGRRGSEASARMDTSTVSTMGGFNDISSPGGARNAPTSDQPQFRRPFGCAVLELTQLSKMLVDQTDVSALKEYTMPIYIPTNEASFSMIHQNIINNNTKEFEKSPRAEGLAVSVKVFRGDVKTVVRENTSLLQDTPHTLRLGFPDVVFPGESRNELYIKLWCGDFTSTLPSSGRLSVTQFARGQMGPPSVNVQITVEIRDQHGVAIPNVISQGSGEPLLTQFHSMVFQRCAEPTFGELIKLQLPNEDVSQWHLFFTFRNRPSKASSKSGDNGERPFAFAFQQLFPDASAFIEDGSHTLIMYRADKVGLIAPSLYLSTPSHLSPGQKVEQLSIPADMLRIAPPLKDTLTIRTSLCSTKYTQNPVLLRLMQWERQDKDVLSTLLTKFTFVGEGEIVKFLRDIFDALFGILVSQLNQAGELDHLVFNALVTVLGIVQDRRFSNFQPVLDVYIEKHFSCAAAASHIIHSMDRLLINPMSTETASPLRAALKVWHYIFKFIARSRELQKAKEMGMGGGATVDYLETTFKRELRSHLSGFTQMMTTSSPPAIIGTQTIALQHFTSILPELAKMFTTIELVSIATTFANAVTVTKGKIVMWKLIMYLQIVKGFLFDNPESRPVLVEAVASWVKPHFGRYDEYAPYDTEAARDAARVSWLESIRLCVTIIAVMLDKLQQNLVKPEIIADRRAYEQEQDNVDSLLSLLPRLLDSYREIQSPASKRALERTKTPSTIKSLVPVTFPESYPFSLISALPEAPRGVSNISYARESNNVFYPALGETAIVLLVLILSSQTKHISIFLESTVLHIEGRDKFTSLLSQFFKVATSILDNEAFPKTWMNVNILAHKVLIKIMEPISAILEKEFIPPQELESQFDANLWREGYQMLLKLLSSEQLMIEEFSPQKRRAVWRLAGDIRGDGATILLNLWQSLGAPDHMSATGDGIRYGRYQVYLHSLVGHVVNLCLSHHDQLRNNAVQILYTIIVSEYQQSEHFDEIENELVTRLDSLFMSDSKGDDISRAFFIGQLRLLFDSSEVNERLRDQVSNFLDSVDLFLELLLSVRALPEGEEYADDRVIATLRLMNFIRRIGRDEIYIKYVHQLVNMHLQSQNYVEAALTLKLHADLHEWDLNQFVGPMEDLGLPQQSHFHRKETLCLLILDYLGKGKAWESAIEICKELAYQHAEVTFNYGRLSEILRHQAALLEHIITEQRYYPDYYRVTFYGNFPAALRDKRFIYRGYEWEKFGAFCERMLNKHPGAQLLKTAGDPPVDIRYGNDKYIQCTAVTPEPQRDHPVFKNPDVPLAVRTYYEHCAISLFSSSRQVRKLARDGMEEVWIEKTLYRTEESFPTVLRRSEVVEFEVKEISPLENALEEVREKTDELTALHIKYQALAKTTQDVSTNALAMSLNSAVDAPLNTGIASYKQIFFSPDYVARHPDRAEMVEQLRVAIDEQVRIIDNCLKLHGLLCPPEFIPFHETLEKFFRKNFRDEIRRLAVDGMSDSITDMGTNISTNGATGRSLPHLHIVTSPSQYPISSNRSISSSTSTAQRFVIPPLNVGRSIMTMTPPLESPVSPGASTLGGGGGNSNTSTHHHHNSAASKQTPLQRHLAHLARHGINGVASGPGDIGGSDSLSAESPHNSFVNVGNGIHGMHGASASTAQMSMSGVGMSGSASYIGSMGSFGSLKGRFSRFGSLSFGRRNASHT